MEKWPNFFIVGAPKAGTTSLYSYLNKIPEIYMSPVKEPNYFSVSVVAEKSYFRPIRDKKKYLKLFEEVKDEKILGEASPRYLSDPETPKLIHEIIPHASIVISLRDPVERLFSHYLHRVRLGIVKSSFKEVLKVELEGRIDRFNRPVDLEFGLYSDNLKTYQDIFGSEHVKLLIFEEWIKNPKHAVEEIVRFLGLNYSLNDFEDESYNVFRIVRGSVAQFLLTNKGVDIAAKFITPSSVRAFLKNNLLLKNGPKPVMDDESRVTLVKFYHDDVQKLQTMLGRKLPWPNFEFKN